MHGLKRPINSTRIVGAAPDTVVVMSDKPRNAKVTTKHALQTLWTVAACKAHLADERHHVPHHIRLRDRAVDVGDNNLGGLVPYKDTYGCVYN